ncbi:MAG: LD-carboxypeptidase [Firmicutes bacterium]|nr:LD-carboxypeptidase [Candidatus Fermentithermobacillaceae bacterium]
MKRKVPALRPGDLIAVVAPSGAVHKEALERGIQVFKEWGFRVKLGDAVFASLGYLAGEDRVRALDFTRAWTDPEVSALVAARGGYGAMRMLPYLDFSVLKRHRKILVGFSDITALHLAFWREMRLVTLHGPMAEMGPEGPGEYNGRILRAALTGQWPPGKLELPAERPLRVLEHGRARGELVGGNLSLIAATIGTRWEIDTRGKILFIEDVGEKPYRVDRMLCQLKLAGKLRDAAGFLIGDFTDCEPDEGQPSLSLSEVLAHYFSGTGKPCLLDVPAGHGKYRAVLPLGVEVEITTQPPEVRFTEGAVGTR